MLLLTAFGVSFSTITRAHGLSCNLKDEWNEFSVPLLQHKQDTLQAIYPLQVVEKSEFPSEIQYVTN
jgi:hypothetical protein